MANIVIFAPKFMGYDDKIRDKLDAMGHQVELFDQRSVRSGLGKAISKKLPLVLKHRNIQYYQRMLAKVSFVPDIIFVIQGDLFERRTMSEIHRQWPNVKTVLYLWDNLENLKGVKKKISWFDKVFSFDPVDSQENESVGFRPLFFSDEFSRVATKHINKYDLATIGTIHSDRYSVISRVTELANESGLSIYEFNYLPARWLFTLYKAFKKSFKNARVEQFSFKKKSLKTISEIQSSTSVILDVNHPKQRGLTMRTIEIMALGKKMITTNQSIVNYDFYNPENIYVMDREHVKLPSKSFFKTMPKPIDTNIKNRYSIEQWIKEVLDL